MQGNVVGLIELDPASEEGMARSFPMGEDATLAEAMHRLAHEEGPIAVDDPSEDFAATAELFAILESSPPTPRWGEASSKVTHLTVDRAALMRDLTDELRMLVDRLLTR